MRLCSYYSCFIHRFSSHVSSLNGLARLLNEQKTARDHSMISYDLKPDLTGRLAANPQDNGAMLQKNINSKAVSDPLSTECFAQKKKFTKNCRSMYIQSLHCVNLLET